jgi:hypothetical protein
MTKRKIPEIDENGQLLEEIEAAEVTRRKALLKMWACHEAYKDAKKAYKATCQECFRVSSQRLE